jgi:hypothetical protein
MAAVLSEGLGRGVEKTGAIVVDPAGSGPAASIDPTF